MKPEDPLPNPIDPDSLRDIYLFQAFDDRQLETMSMATERIRLTQGKRLFDQGDRIRWFFYLRSGRVKLYRLSVEGNEKVIDLIGSGRTFAEAVVFMEEESGYPVNAEALETSDLLRFSAPTFLGLLKESNASCLRLLGVMSKRLRWQVNEIDRLTLQNATSRFVGYLLNPASDDMVDGDRVELAVPKNVLASRLSIQPETFSRILSRLQSSGLIEVERQVIRLRDIRGLSELLKTPN